MRSQPVWKFSVFILLMGLPVHALSTGLDRQMRTEDKRLDKPVTISAQRLYLGELLERLTLQTGAELTIDDNDKASGLEITVECARMPAGDMLDSIWALVSNRKAEWKWIRRGKPGSYSYLLLETSLAKERAARIREYSQAILDLLHK